MELKYVDELEWAFDEILEPFGLSSRLASEWAYYTDEEVVEFSLTRASNASIEFMESVERLNPAYECDEMLWSLFHEIGHHFTKHLFSSKQWKRYRDDVAAIEKNGNSKDYYNLPIERAATAWAVEYINKNAIELMDKWAKLVKSILQFYKENDIYEG